MKSSHRMSMQSTILLESKINDLIDFNVLNYAYSLQLRYCSRIILHTIPPLADLIRRIRNHCIAKREKDGA